MTLGFDGFALPAPTEWQRFERLCRDLWASIWGDPNAQLNGRSGQSQAGVDVYGQSEIGVAFSGIQCRRKGTTANDAEISEEELRAEVAKAKTFAPALKGDFIFAFTGKRDAKIQAVAREITAEHEALGLFRVAVFSWDDIQERLGEHPHVVAKHYSSFFASFRALEDRVLPEPPLPSAEVPVPPELAGRARAAILADDTAQIEAEHRAEIQMVRLALKEGHSAVALAQAQALRARIWASASAEARARLLVLIAHAHFELGEDSLASTLLLEAAGHAPDNAYVQAQVAMGHSLLGNEAAAVAWAAKALDQNPTDIIAVQVAALYDQRHDEAILEAHESVIGKKAELYSILGHRALRRNETKKARIWFERAVELEPKAGEISATAAQAILDSIRSSPTSTSILSTESRSDLERAVVLLDNAISNLKDGAAHKAHSGWYVSRILAKRLLNAPDVVSVADQALTACGRVDALIRARAAVASDAGDHRMVVELIEGVPKPWEAADIGLLAAALGNLGEHRKATELWEGLLARPLPVEVLHEIRRNYAISLILEGRNAEARAAIDAGLEAKPGELSPILVAIVAAERLGDVEQRDKLLDAAIVVAAETPAFLSLELGDALMRAERWNDAADVYAKVVPSGSDDVYGFRILQALYKAGRFESALRRCDGLDARDGRSRFAAEMRSSIFEILGDMERAEKACRDFLTVDPRNPVLGLRLALVLQRRGDVAGSEIALKAVDFNAVMDIQSAGILAQMLIRIGKPQDGLEVAYRLRRRHPHDVDAHLRYVSIYTLARGLNASEEADQVTLDSAVRLEGPGAPGWILVSSFAEADLNQKEYPPDHVLARNLLGKRVGDAVSIEGPASSWTVAAIGTKYGFAFGRTLELFPAHFPANREIEQHPIPETDAAFVDNLKERLQQGDPRRQATLSQYAAGRCTIGCIATVLGLTTWEAIGTVLSSPAGLMCSTNSVDERKAGLAALAVGKVPLLLDLTAILTLDAVGLLRDGSLAGYQLHVAQRTFDEVASEHFRWQTISSEGAMSIGIEGNTLVRYVTTAEDVTRLRGHFADLLQWLRTHVVVAPVPPEVAERHAAQDQFGDFIGDSSWDTMRIATTQNMLLISDDLWLRQLSNSAMAVNGICSAVLLLAEMQAGRLDRKRYSEAIVKLIVSGYRNLSIDGEILETAARADQWRCSSFLGKVLDRLRGPETEVESAIVVGVDFIRRIWLNVVLSQQRVTLLIAVLDALTAGRNRADVLKRVRRHLAQALLLLPLAQEEVLRVLSGWNAMGIVEVTS